MRILAIRTIITILLALTLSGCTSLNQFMAALTKSGRMIGELTPSEVMAPLPKRPLYVLTVSEPNLGDNQLVIVDADTWQVTQWTWLPRVAPWDLSRDPEGRVWIGYGAQPGGDKRVQIYAPDGALLKTLSLCIDPYLPIHFAAGRAFVPCLQSGFEAAVVIIDLASLEVIRQVDIRPRDDTFLLLATGGNEDYFALVGNGDISPSNRIILLDTHTLVTLDPLPIPISNAQAVLAYHGRLLLLNSIAESLLRNGMVEPLPAGRPDLLIVDTEPEPMLTTYEMVEPGALWGVLEGDMLYAYHNAELLGFNSDSFRAVSRLNLITNESELWPLPDGWNARDLALVNGKIILVHSLAPEPEKAGLYHFDPASGELTLLVNIPGAQRILPPTE